MEFEIAQHYLKFTHSCFRWCFARFHFAAKTIISIELSRGKKRIRMEEQLTCVSQILSSYNLTATKKFEHVDAIKMQ